MTLSKAQAARDVDAALGVVRSGHSMPRIPGFNSHATRLMVRIGWVARYERRMPTTEEMAEMQSRMPGRLNAAESACIAERVRAIAEREGWLS